jgi:hypothetical protein
MGVPSWVYDDTISEEEKLERFQKDMRFNLYTLLSSVIFILGFILGKVI